MMLVSTMSNAMAGKRDHVQLCGIAAGLNVIGYRWTLLVAQELLTRSARFTS
jgi:DNA-binding HxlR family transcriptional regulator